MKEPLASKVWAADTDTVDVLITASMRRRDAVTFKRLLFRA